MEDVVCPLLLITISRTGPVPMESSVSNPFAFFFAIFPYGTFIHLSCLPSKPPIEYGKNPFCFLAFVDHYTEEFFSLRLRCGPLICLYQGRSPTI